MINLENEKIQQMKGIKALSKQIISIVRKDSQNLMTFYLIKGCILVALFPFEWGVNYADCMLEFNTNFFD
jgi:hypothetical protein